MTNFYYGTGRKITAADFTALAKKYGIDESRLRAVAEVEARGSGYDSAGRLIALYEPHIAYKYTKDPVRAKLVKAGIAYKTWVRNYPKTSYDRIDLCISIAGEEIAAMSTSFGMGQIMGFNYAMLGFPNALTMVKWLALSEANQLEGIVKFAQAKGIFNALKKGDWATFARGYNGDGYAANQYDVKLANADKKWRAKLNDSKFTPVSFNATTDIGTKGQDVVAVQEALQTAGYDVDADGDFGGHTEEVLKQFQEDNGLVADGSAGPLTKQALAEVVDNSGGDASAVLGQPPAVPQPGFFSRFGYWFGSMPFAGGLAFFNDWRILLGLFVGLLIIAGLAIFAQDKIIKAYQNYRKAFE